jgi:hypothetical protein
MPDARYPAIVYEWAWRSRTWRAVAAGLLIIAEAETAAQIVARAWAWAWSNEL